MLAKRVDLSGGASCRRSLAEIFAPAPPRKFSSRNITKLYIFWYSLEVVHKELISYGR